MSALEKIVRKLKKHSVGLEIEQYKSIRSFFKDKLGIEIGGPSGIFKDKDILPIYSDAQRVDGVNFSTLTVWENAIVEGQTYDYAGSQKGYQFIAEASNLEDITDDSYDFLLSSHSLEHCANVIKTVNEWKRVVRSKGIMVVVVPTKDFTFDHKRNVTTFDHLIDDYQKEIDEDDLTHLQEIIDEHDISLDPGIDSREQFIERSKKNLDYRCLHHHIFDEELLIRVVQYLNMKVLFTSLKPPYHTILVAQKL